MRFAVRDDVLSAIETFNHLAPLHNPANVLGIRVARDVLPSSYGALRRVGVSSECLVVACQFLTHCLSRRVPHVAVFDTAFHATMPERAYRYAIPHGMCDELNVRRYGFHGTSHAYVAGTLPTSVIMCLLTALRTFGFAKKTPYHAGAHTSHIAHTHTHAHTQRTNVVITRAGQAAVTVGKELSQLNAISLHIGNGVSVAAIKGGKSVDTTMGLSPLEVPNSGRVGVCGSVSFCVCLCVCLCVCACVCLCVCACDDVPSVTGVLIGSNHCHRQGAIMGTRCGDIDPTALLLIAEKRGMEPADVLTMLNRER